MVCAPTDTASTDRDSIFAPGALAYAADTLVCESRLPPTIRDCGPTSCTMAPTSGASAIWKTNELNQDLQTYGLARMRSRLVEASHSNRQEAHTEQLCKRRDESAINASNNRAAQARVSQRKRRWQLEKGHGAWGGGEGGRGGEAQGGRHELIHIILRMYLYHAYIVTWS